MEEHQHASYSTTHSNTHFFSNLTIYDGISQPCFRNESKYKLITLERISYDLNYGVKENVWNKNKILIRSVRVDLLSKK